MKLSCCHPFFIQLKFLLSIHTVCTNKNKKQRQFNSSLNEDLIYHPCSKIDIINIAIYCDISLENAFLNQLMNLLCLSKPSLCNIYLENKFRTGNNSLLSNYQQQFQEYSSTKNTQQPTPNGRSKAQASSKLKRLNNIYQRHTFRIMHTQIHTYDLFRIAERKRAITKFGYRAL